jgi:hypothetical protein
MSWSTSILEECRPGGKTTLGNNLFGHIKDIFTIA